VATNSSRLGQTDVNEAKRPLYLDMEAGIQLLARRCLLKGIVEGILATRSRESAKFAHLHENTFRFGGRPTSRLLPVPHLRAAEASSAPQTRDYIESTHMHGFDQLNSIEET